MADKLEEAGLSRVGATALITVLAVLIFVLMVLLVVPTLISQTAGLIETLPKAFNDLQAFLTAKFPLVLDHGSTIGKTQARIGEMIQSQGKDLINTLMDATQ